jgi:hypothetical protein
VELVQIKMKYIVTTADCTLLHNEKINGIVKKPKIQLIYLPIRNSQANLEIPDRNNGKTSNKGAVFLTGRRKRSRRPENGWHERERGH